MYDSRSFDGKDLRLNAKTLNLSLIFSIFLLSFQANGDSSLGKYGGGVVGAAGQGSLFVANHAY